MIHSLLSITNLLDTESSNEITADVAALPAANMLDPRRDLVHRDTDGSGRLFTNTGTGSIDIVAAIGTNMPRNGDTAAIALDGGSITWTFGGQVTLYRDYFIALDASRSWTDVDLQLAPATSQHVDVARAWAGPALRGEWGWSLEVTGQEMLRSSRGHGTQRCRELDGDLATNADVMTEHPRMRRRYRVTLPVTALADFYTGTAGDDSILEYLVGWLRSREVIFIPDLTGAERVENDEAGGVFGYLDASVQRGACYGRVVGATVSGRTLEYADVTLRIEEI